MKCSSRRNCNTRPSQGSRDSRRLNEVQFPKELQHLARNHRRLTWRCLNEVQFPKELQHGVYLRHQRQARPASMKCSSRRNCNLCRIRHLQQVCRRASMKCSSRRNCNDGGEDPGDEHVAASMKCSSRRNCNTPAPSRPTTGSSLNEVQFPKELQRGTRLALCHLPDASMKCSSRRNCNGPRPSAQRKSPRLNEVQFPKELQPWLVGCLRHVRRSLNEVQFPKELQRPCAYERA